jgi:Na+-transporting NADH:ubiquinone oxidoreductase subunit C
MDVNSNKYTYLFSVIMVVVVAAILSIAATSLKPFQQANVKLEKMQDILRSINVDVKRADAEPYFEQYITEMYVIKNGEKCDACSEGAFDIDMSKQVGLPKNERSVPLYIADKEGETFYIIPLRGRGLWGPIWGYISLKEDVSTVYGATFDHKSETPGLGAEINTGKFQDQFQGKQILSSEGNFVSVSVKKGSASGYHEVDGISGGTITSDGVGDMLQDCIAPYVEFLKNKKNGQVAGL